MLDPVTVRAVTDWAAVHGVRTPAFVVAPIVAQQAVARLRAELGGKISYAVKSNASLPVVRILLPLVDAFNVTNPAHTRLLVDLGVDPAKIAFIHPVTTVDTVAAVAALGVRRFVVDDMRGVRVLQAALGKSLATTAPWSSGEPWRVTVRILPPEVRESDSSMARFGALPGDVAALAREADCAGLVVEGLSFFLGGNVASPDAYRRAFATTGQLLAGLGDAGGKAVPAINIGGGFPGSRSAFFRDHPDFFGDIAAIFREFHGPDVELWSEPGRFLCQGAVALLTRVVTARAVGSRRVVFLDASAYGGLVDCFIHRGRPLLFQAANASMVTPCDITGPLMDSHDLIRPGAAGLGDAPDGTLVVVSNIGAYTWGMATSCEGVQMPDVLELPESLAVPFASTWYDGVGDEADDPCAA